MTKEQSSGQRDLERALKAFFNLDWYKIDQLMVDTSPEVIADDFAESASDDRCQKLASQVREATELGRQCLEKFNGIYRGVEEGVYDEEEAE